MGVFDSLNDASEKAVDSGQRYFDASQDYFKLKIFHQITKLSSFFGKIVLIGGMLFLGLTFFSVASVVWLGELLENFILACLLVAAFFFVCGIVIYVFRKHIETAILRKLSNEFFD